MNYIISWILHGFSMGKNGGSSDGKKGMFTYGNHVRSDFHIGFSDDFEWLEHAKTRNYREV